MFWFKARGLLFCLSLLVLCAAATAQDFSRELSFQGRLAEPGTGTPLADGEYQVQFAIYDAETEGNALWQETQDITQMGGVFSIHLGSVTPFPGDLFEGGDRWLSIRVGEDQEMGERFRFTPSPWSFYALSGGEDDGDWTISGNDIYSALSGNVGIGTSTPSAKLEVITDQEISAGRFLSPYSTVLYAEHTDNALEDAVAVQGVSVPAAGYGIGAEFQGGRKGVYGFVDPADSNRGGEFIGVHGFADASWNTSIGVKGEAASGPGQDSIAYGVYGTALDGGGKDYAGYFVGAVQVTGAVGIGQTRPQATKLLVDAPGAHAGTFYSMDRSYVIHAEYNGSPEAADAVAVEGISVPMDGFGFGGAFEGGHKGVWGRVTPSGSMPEYIGVQGDVDGGSGVNYGLKGNAETGSAGANTRGYGVHGLAAGPGMSCSIYGAVADDGTTEYAGYFEGKVNVDGDLDVNGALETDGFALTDNPTDGYVLTSDASGNGTWQETPGIGGGGTADYIPIFTAAKTLGDSVIYQSGADVAVGHTSPQSRLDVDGTVQMTGFKMPVGHQSGHVLTSDGSGGGTWEEAPGGMGGGGSIKRIAKFTDAHAVGDSVIYQDGNRVGIGGPPSTVLAGSPKLHVLDGAEYARVWIGRDQETNGAQIGELSFIGRCQGNAEPVTYASVLGQIVDSGSFFHKGALLFSTASDGQPVTEHMRIMPSGKVGIGTDDPGRLLHVGNNDSPSDGVIRVGHKDESYYRQWDFGIGDPDIFGHSNNFGFRDLGGGRTIMVLETTTEGGGVGIGVESPAQALDVDGNVRIRGLLTGGATYDVQVQDDGDLVRVTSSKRYKRDIRDLVSGESDTFRLRPVSFTWKETGDEDVGLIAEEVAELIPDLVVYDAQGRPDAVKYDKLALYLLAAMKELRAENEALRHRIEALEGEAPAD